MALKKKPEVKEVKEAPKPKKFELHQDGKKLTEVHAETKERAEQFFLSYVQRFEKDVKDLDGYEIV